MHTKRSPSQATKFGACCGTLALCESLPPEQRGGSGDAARIGTCAHKLIEHTLRRGEEPSAYRGRIIEIVNEGEDGEGCVILKAGAKTPGRDRIWFEVDDAMIDGATLMTDYVRQRCEELEIEPGCLQLETRTNPLPDRDDTSGTADVTIDAWPTLLEVADYKNGYLRVDAEDNDQLLAYLLGKALETEFTHESYRVTVIQPNCPHEAGRIRWVDATKAELLAFQKQYAARIAKCEEAEDHKDAPKAGVVEVNAKWAKKYLKAGEHCTFCDAKAVCPAFIAATQKDAQHDFADEPTDLELPTHEDGVARILAWAPKMEALIAAAAAWAFRAMESGHKVPGHKLVRGRSNRKWCDMGESELVAAIVKEGFVKDRAALYTKPALLTGPAAEKLVPRKRRPDFNSRFLDKPEGKLTVAPEDDPRDAVTVNVADDFADAEDEMDFG